VFSPPRYSLRGGTGPGKLKNIQKLEIEIGNLTFAAGWGRDRCTLTIFGSIRYAAASSTGQGQCSRNGRRPAGISFRRHQGDTKFLVRRLAAAGDCRITGH